MQTPRHLLWIYRAYVAIFFLYLVAPLAAAGAFAFNKITGSTLAEITDVNAGTAGSLLVSAVNEAGTGPARDAGSATTHDVPAVPEDLVVEEVTTTTVTLEWDDPEHNGGMPVTSFHVQYQLNGVESVLISNYAPSPKSRQLRI